MKAAARVVGLVASSLLLLGSLLVASLAIWLRTASGHGWVERALVREARERLGLTLSVGRTRGDVIRGLRLEAIVARDARGRVVARADALSLRYRLGRLVRFHEVDEVAVARPVIVRLPSAPSARARGEPTTFSVHELTVTDGEVRWRGHRVEHLSGSTSLDARSTRALLDGDMNGVVDGRRLSVRARATRDGSRVQLSAELRGRAFAARAHGDWAHGRLAAVLDSLDVDEALLAGARPLAGRGALHAHGVATGPLDALEVELRGHTGDRGLAVGARVDAPRRAARVLAFVAAPDRSAALRARGALRGRTLELTALDARAGATRLRGAARVGTDRLDGTLDARVAPAEAAAIGLRPAAPIRLRLTAHGPLRALDVHADGELDTARAALDARIDLHARRGRARVQAHDVRVSQIVRNAPPLAFSGAFALEGGLDGHAGVAGDLSVTDGSLRVARLTFDRLHGSSRVRLGRNGEAHVESLCGRLAGTRPRRVDVAAVVRWDRRAVRIEVKRAAADDNHATGEVVYTTDPVTRRALVAIRAHQLYLSPPLVEEALHRRPASAWTGRASFAWTRGDSRLAFALATDLGPAKGIARLRRGRRGIELPRIAVDLGGSRLRGEARVEHGEIVASLDELLLEPELVRALSPALRPARTLRIVGAAAGPLDALQLHLLATAGASTARLRGRVDLRAKSFRLYAALDTFYLQSIKEKRTTRLNLELALLGRVVEGGVAGTLTVRRAWGVLEGLPLHAGRLDAKLDGAKFNIDPILLGVPGAVIEGKGGGTYRDFHIGYGVVITDALELRKVPKSLRVMVGITALTPGRSVVGSVQRRGGGAVKLTHHAIPPPFRILNLLAHLMTGHPPHLTVK
jgi:hypothetical protein